MNPARVPRNSPSTRALFPFNGSRIPTNETARVDLRSSIRSSFKRAWNSPVAARHLATCTVANNR